MMVTRAKIKSEYVDVGDLPEQDRWDRRRRYYYREYGISVDGGTFDYYVTEAAARLAGEKEIADGADEVEVWYEDYDAWWVPAKYDKYGYLAEGNEWDRNAGDAELICTLKKAEP